MLARIIFWTFLIGLIAFAVAARLSRRKPRAEWRKSDRILQAVSRVLELVLLAWFVFGVYKGLFLLHRLDTTPDRQDQSGSLNSRRLLAAACADSEVTSSPFNSATAHATNGSSAGSL